MNLSPESPHHTAVYGTAVGDAAESRWSSDGSTLGAGVDATETALTVVTMTGPLWTTAAARYPMAGRLRGEKITVTAVSGTTSPQTFTVTRSVNGVTLTHPAGTTFELWRPVYYATREGA